MVRQYNKLENGSYRFRDYNGKQVIREVRSLKMFPVILDGECKEYYENGHLKSVSQYSHNELIGTLNRLQNGDKYIDSDFYSVDAEPLLTGGNARLYQHVLQAWI